jgi:hypothetical protein
MGLARQVDKNHRRWRILHVQYVLHQFAVVIEDLHLSATTVTTRCLAHGGDTSIIFAEDHDSHWGYSYSIS